MTDWSLVLKDYGTIDHHVPMAPHTTLGIGGPADWFFKPASRNMLIAAIPHIPAHIAIMPLGRGSNMLIPDQGIRALVLDLGHINAMHIDKHQLYAEAGSRMAKLSQLAASHACTGLEFMATVPGDLGGGVAMNAGCFGQQVSDCIESAEILLRDGNVQSLKRHDLDMQYRHTRLPHQGIILSATFSLQSDDGDNIRERMRTFRQRRTDTQPLAQPNCGSVFKNPPGDYAARLIEACGLKGYRIGDARFSDVHANFIVNQGHASCQDVLSLIAKAQTHVADMFHIQLEPEVRYIGEHYDR